jgi:5'-deoxynucleotidase YfbR-like HD superfamily hydrolase
VSDPEAILARSFDQVTSAVAVPLRARLRAQLGQPATTAAVPAFAEALIRQPRAGATCPGKPRLVLEPPENHGEHCLVVAVLGCVLAGLYGADPAVAFVAGMAHHLHNAWLPDSGFAGEILLGEELAPLMQRLFDRELATLSAPVAATVRRALATIGDADTPEGRAFNAADVMDRVLQMRQYERVAGFTTSQALVDLELVHAGPLQAFHHAVLAEAGLV